MSCARALVGICLPLTFSKQAICYLENVIYINTRQGLSSTNLLKRNVFGHKLNFILQDVACLISLSINIVETICQASPCPKACRRLSLCKLSALRWPTVRFFPQLIFFTKLYMNTDCVLLSVNFLKESMLVCFGLCFLKKLYEQGSHFILHYFFSKKLFHRKLCNKIVSAQRFVL